MKNNFKILTLVMIGLVFISSCKKDPDLNMPTMEYAVFPLIKKDLSKDYSISISDPAAFQGKLNVSLFFPDKPKSMDLMVIYGNYVTEIVAGSPVTSLKFYSDSAGVLESNITSFPMDVDVTWAKLAAATKKPLATLKTGNSFKIYPVYTLESGRVVNGNDPNYAIYAQSLLNVPGASAFVTYSVVCPLDFNDFLGAYDMYEDGALVSTATTVIQDPDKTYGFIIQGFYGGTAGIGQPVSDIKFEYDPFTFVLNFNPAKQKFTSSIGAYPNGYLSSVKGDLLTCSTTISFKANLTVDAGSFGVIQYDLVHQ